MEADRRHQQPAQALPGQPPARLTDPALNPPRPPRRRPRSTLHERSSGDSTRIYATGSYVSALDRGARPDYAAWLRHVYSAAGCSNPVRLSGHTFTVDGRTGDVLTERHTNGMPDAVIYKACGNRRSAVCPSCAEVYRADAYQLVLAGIKGGKGVPDTVAGHPAVFATATAPGFGIVHTQRKTKKGKKPLPCRARRKLEWCPHG